MPLPDEQRTGAPAGRGPHPDDDTLAVLALGEHDDADVAAHVAGCGRCRAEVQSLAEVVRVGRSFGGSDEATLMPPRSVWERIAAEVGIDAALLPSTPDRALDVAVRETATSAPITHLSEHPSRSAAAAPGLHGSTSDRRPSRTGLLVAASVIGALLGIGATLGWQALDEESSDVLASTTLAPLPEKVGTGTAEVRSAGDRRELDLALDAAAPAEGFLQVWLLSPDAGRMVLLGVLEGGSGSFVLPPGVQLEDYPVVDVSIEPYDGDPLHSSNSLVRGTLNT